MSFRDYLPIFGASTPSKHQTQAITLDDQKSLTKALKISALAMGLPSSLVPTSRTKIFEQAPYDFGRIIQAVDTDSYVQQAFSKYGELFWKEGWDIVGENSDAVDYLWQRIDFLEIAMNKPFQDFLDEVSDQLFKFHNVFIVKARGNLAPYFPGKLKPQGDQDPIIGYYLIPTEQVEIVRDRYNRPRWYRQRIDATSTFAGTFISQDAKLPLWKAEDVIHLYRKKKPGRAFGTPFVAAALDDVIAVRQLEEDAQNLSHREMFPFYLYQIGTEDHPASDEEIEAARMEIESIRSEGGLIVPHRHNVEILGAEGKSLDIAPYLAQFKERLANGLGLYPHHLGMTDGANRDATDRLDIALYDRIKDYQRYFSDSMRFFFFNELLIEGGFDPFKAPQEKDISDRCAIRFNEIDVDTQVKKEANVMAKVTTGLETIPEGRLELHMKPEQNEADTIQGLQLRMTPNQIVTPKAPAGSTATPAPKMMDTTPPAAQKPNGQPSSTGGRPNSPNLKKGAGNVIRPTNQYGTRTSPNIRHSEEDEKWLNDVVELLGEEPLDKEG